MPFFKTNGKENADRRTDKDRLDYSDSDYSSETSGSSSRSEGSRSISFSASASLDSSRDDSSRSSSDEEDSSREERGNAKAAAKAAKGAGKAKKGKGHMHGKGKGHKGKGHKNGKGFHRDGPAGGPVYAGLNAAGNLSGTVGDEIKAAFDEAADVLTPAGHNNKGGSGRLRTTTQMGKGRSHANRSAPVLASAESYGASPMPAPAASASAEIRPFQLGRMVHYDTKNGAAHFKVPITFSTTGRARDFDGHTERMEFEIPSAVIEQALDTHMRVHSSELGAGIFHAETKDRILPYAIDVHRMHAEHIDDLGRGVAPLAHDVGLSFEPSQYPSMSLLNQQPHSSVPGRAFVGHTGLHSSSTNSIAPRLSSAAVRMDTFDATHELGKSRVVGNRIKGDSYIDIKKDSRFYKALAETEPYKNWVSQQKGEGKHRETAEHVHDVLDSTANDWAKHIQTSFDKEYLRHDIFGGMKFKIHPIPTREQAAMIKGDVDASRNWTDETESSYKEPMRVSVAGYAHFAIPLQREI